MSNKSVPTAPINRTTELDSSEISDIKNPSKLVAIKVKKRENASTNGVYQTPSLFDNLVWLTSVEAAIYLRKFTDDGKPSLNAIWSAVCRGQLRARKWRRRLYFRKVELDRLLESSESKGGF